MSLLNDALRDLEQRQAPVGMLDLPGLTDPAPRRAKQRLVLPAAVMMVGVVLSGAGYWAWSQQIGRPSAVESVETGQLSGAKSVVATAALTEVKRGAIGTASVSETTADIDTGPVIESVPVVETVPVEETVQVRETMPAIEMTSVTEIAPVNKVIPVNELASVNELTPVAERSAVRESAPITEPIAVADPVPVREEPHPTPLVAENAAQDLIEVASPQRAEARVEPVATRTESIRLLTPEQEDQQTAKAAAQLLRGGRSLEAEEMLRRQLSTQPEANLSRAVYAQWLLRTARAGEAERLLERVDATSSAELKRLKARLLHGQGQVSLALDLLRRNPPGLAEAPDYHALLAALYSQQGQFAEAAGIYAGLVGVRPSQADWWAGLGVALDGEGQRESARRAYDQALGLGGLHPELQAYVRSRRQAL